VRLPVPLPPSSQYALTVWSRSVSCAASPCPAQHPPASQCAPGPMRARGLRQIIGVRWPQQRCHLCSAIEKHSPETYRGWNDESTIGISYSNQWNKKCLSNFVSEHQNSVHKLDIMWVWQHFFKARSNRGNAIPHGANSGPTHRKRQLSFSTYTETKRMSTPSKRERA